MAIPSSKDITEVVANDGVVAVVAFLNRTARDVSSLLEGRSNEVALLPGAAYHAVGKFSPIGHDFDVLAVEEILHEDTQAPAPQWPHEGAKIADLISEALSGDAGEPTTEVGRYVGPLPLTAATAKKNDDGSDGGPDDDAADPEAPAEG
ncbi:hypothetical protein GCM10025865_09840 [Paraoerskovia sediminicola]|uniref:Uncharacterized protein n=1 Tax=Paraoerskovia sediminicola TaxID=1138587 RepID=A0ABM8G197_9CELL|nr:hypothetical protein [Paraoerskovia sediminicola]BDZ41685.1 hypothetical protein GCM10025865_09840 [Paraoerskovia sediminicola]